jgi:hypothetical protein
MKIRPSLPGITALLPIGLLVAVPAFAAPKTTPKPIKKSALPPVPIADSLQRGWNAPPQASKPFVYWYWLNNIVTKEGITRDLEMMAKNGIGGAYIGHIGGFDDTPNNGRAVGYSDEWYGLMQHAVREGLRLGVQIGVFNGPGWSQSGGPWVKPEDSMQFIDSAEVRVVGGTRFNGILPRVKGAVRDVRTIAFPAPSQDGQILKPLKASSEQGAELAQLADGMPHELPANKDYGRLGLTFEFETPQTVRSLLFQHHDGNQVEGQILVSQDGTDFQPLRRFKLDRRGGEQVSLPDRPSAVSTPPTTARFFRIEMPWETRRDGRRLGIAFSGAARLESAEEKQLGIASRQNTPDWDTFMWPATPEPGGGTIAPGQVLDLTAQVGADGRLGWDVPAGEWIVQRVSTVSTGVESNPAPGGMGGLEIDKMSREAAKRHIDNGLVRGLWQRLTPTERKGFTYAIADSYERGFQNWTAQMIPEFQKRYGYDPTPWLPVFSGRIVGSAQQSDRFLWDVRRLVADLIATNYVGGLRDAVHPLGLKLWLENYGHWGFPSEFGVYGGQTDGLGGEFWNNVPNLGTVETRDAASTGHTYGKNIISAEAFTSVGYQFESPGYLKARGDWAFTQGINHYVLHVVSHQPTEVPGPGLMLQWGTYFNRKSLWFMEHGKAWSDYVRRSSFLLQQGRPVADVAYYIGEDTPQMNGKLDPELPKGYDYDWINSEVIVKRGKVEKGRLVLPGGASYAILAIPARASMRPEVLQRIAGFVRQGLTVVGTAPRQSPSLQDYPRADAKIQALAAQLWPASGEKSRAVGRGRVWNAAPLGPILSALKTGPAVTEANEQVLWKQRSTPDAEIFYLSNQSDQKLQIAPSFRIAGRAPQLWDAETGRVQELGAYRQAAGRTTVPLTLAPLQSVFVIFRSVKAPGAAVTELKREGQSVFAWSEASASQPGESADSNLSQSFRIRPSGTINLPAQRLGAVELQRQRWALAPLQGNTARGEGFAGTGVSVGTNGIVVVQHWAFNAPAVLVWKAPAPLLDSIHVTVAYRAGVPHLYVNGLEVAQGLRSGQRIIAGVPGEEGETFSDSPFDGGVRGLKTSTELTSAQIAAMSRDLSDESVATPLSVRVVQDAAGIPVVQTNLGGSYQLTLGKGETRSVRVPAPLPLQTLASPWNVAFSGAAAPPAQRWASLKSWSDAPDEATKYFSGNATYTTTFQIPAGYDLAKMLCTLDLGRVEIVARVSVNGRPAGTALRPPYRLEVGPLLKAGTNTLSVLVTSTWANRMIGDEQFPDDLAATRDGGGNLTKWPEWAFTGAPRPEPRRVTLSARRPYNKDSALNAAGLIGPVKLRFESSVAVGQAVGQVVKPKKVRGS